MKPKLKIAIISGSILCSFVAYRVPWLIYAHAPNIPTPCPASETAAQACINNLKQIDSAIAELSLTNQGGRSGTNL